jgi:hypothetical protein
MNFLIIDHFFKQDIEALINNATGHQAGVSSPPFLQRIAQQYLPSWALSRITHFFKRDSQSLVNSAMGHHFRILSYSLFHRIARKHLPSWAFSSLKAEDFARPDYVEAHKDYKTKICKIIRRIYLEFPFDAVIIPSDTIFYLRACVACAHELGKPVIILQKETTISPFDMIETARELGKIFPLMSDLMLVCSERHKQFWLNSGASEEKIIVTGQPRFDFYRQPERWRTWADLGLHVPADKPSILFFSYDVGAYSPEGVLAPTWYQLRRETEDALMDLAQQGLFNILIKPHPQQQEVKRDHKRLQENTGALWGKSILLVPAECDTRQLIVNSDVVVGFQTTALFEAMIAGKKVAYTFWTKPTAQYAAALIPFHEMEDALCIAKSPQDLKRILFSEQPGICTEKYSQCRLQEFERYIGPFDGHASERCIKLIEKFVTEGEALNVV